MRSSSSGWLPVLAILAGCSAPGGSAFGRVTWSGTAAGEQISVTLLGPVTRAAQTDAEGNWDLRELPPGQYAVLAEAADSLERSATTTLEVLEKRVTEAEPLTLTAVGKISGVVTRAGAASHEGSLVLAIGGAGSGQTAADGSFVVSGIPAGRRDLLIHAPGFAQARITGVEVRRGVTTSIPPTQLAPVDSGTGPLVGALRGRAWLPGTDDHSGIRVELAGTPVSVLTAADGSFALENVPNGIVGLSFRKGPAAATLSRVLVVSGSDGFIVDGGLYDLGRLPVPLRRGTRLLDSAAGVLAASADGRWAVLQSGPPYRLWLLGPGNELTLLVPESSASFSNLGFSGEPSPSTYWFWSSDGKQAQSGIQQVSLATRTVRPFATFQAYQSLRFAAVGTGAAWLNASTLFLRESAAAPELRRFEGKARWVAALGADRVLVAAESALHELKLDGTALEVLPVPQGADWFVLSPDRRWVVVGVEQAGAPNPVLIDRTAKTSTPLPAACRSPQFSPDSGALLCDTVLHWLEADGTLTSRTVGQHYGTPWLPEGRVALMLPPSLRIVTRGSRADILVGGLSWDAPQLFLTTDGKRVRMLANLDPVSGLGQALEVTLADGAVAVIADGAASRPFLSNDRGVLIARPRTIGTDLDLCFVPLAGPEVGIGRTTRTGTSALSSSTAGTWYGARRFAPGRGIESVVLDTRGGPEPVTAIASGYVAERWLDDRRLLQSASSAAPFSESSGLFLLELP